MKRYIEASPKARLVFFLLALLLTVLVAILQRVDEWFPMKGISLEQFPDRALLYLLIDVSSNIPTFTLDWDKGDATEWYLLNLFWVTIFLYMRITGSGLNTVRIVHLN